MAGLSPYSLHHTSPPSSPLESLVTNNSTRQSAGLLSTVSAASTTTMTTTRTAISRIGNLDRLIDTLNTNLPDHTILLRQPNLTRNQVVKQKAMINSATITPVPEVYPHQIALAMQISSHNAHNSPSSSFHAQNLTTLADATSSCNKFSVSGSFCNNIHGGLYALMPIS